MAVNPAEVEIVVQIDRLEREMGELKHEYEQYFLGLVRMEPAQKRKELQSLILRLGNRQIVNSALRFRFQQLRSRFNTFQTYWNRILHEIETGRYKREERRYEMRQRQTPSERTDEESAPTPEPEAPREDPRVRTLYESFVSSRRQTGERTDNVTVDRLAQFISQQEEQLRSRYGDRQIDFKVVVEDGKAKLRAILRKEPGAPG